MSNQNANDENPRGVEILVGEERVERVGDKSDGDLDAEYFIRVTPRVNNSSSDITRAIRDYRCQ